MTKDEAIEAYIKKFGGFPYFQTMGMPSSEIVKAVKKALADGVEIKPEEGVDY